MLYEDYSTFIGTERVVGKLDGRSGCFVLDHRGTHKSGVGKSSFQIVENSGTGELSSISGEGKYEAMHEKIHLC